MTPVLTQHGTLSQAQNNLNLYTYTSALQREAENGPL